MPPEATCSFCSKPRIETSKLVQHCGRPRFTDFLSNLANLISPEYGKKTLRMLRKLDPARYRDFLVLTKKSAASEHRNELGEGH